MPNPISDRVIGFLSKLSYPRLFLVAAGLFVVDTLIPDIIPFADEILIAMGALLISRFRKRKEPDVIDAKPR